MKTKSLIATLGMVGTLALTGCSGCLDKLEKQQREEQRQFDIEHPIFPEDKILTISARDYCDSIGKSSSNYNFVGVHANYGLPFNRRIPTDADVVVEYTSNPTGGDGTALIPKKEFKHYSDAELGDVK